MRFDSLLKEAQVFNRCYNGKTCLYPLVFFTDRNRFKNIFEIVGSIPHQTMVIIRDYDLSVSARRNYGRKIVKICRDRGLKVLVGKDPVLAMDLNADGIHTPESLLAFLLLWRDKKPEWILTTACHSRSSLVRIERCGVDATFVSPVFPTKSHPGSKTLGVDRFRKIVCDVKIPIYALGGINDETIHFLQGTNIVGVAGIDMFGSVVK